MPITISCNNSVCGKPLRVRDELAGKRVKCPSCGHVMVASQSDLVAASDKPRVESRPKKQSLDWLMELIKKDSPWAVQARWEHLSKSKNPRLAALAMLWNSATLLAFAETTKVIVIKKSVSIIVALFRSYKKTDKRLLWVEDSNRAIQCAESAQEKDPRYSNLADQIIERAKLVGAIKEDEASQFANCLVIEVIDNDSSLEAQLLLRSRVNSKVIVECVESLADNQMMFEGAMSEADWVAAFQAVMKPY